MFAHSVSIWVWGGPKDEKVCKKEDNMGDRNSSRPSYNSFPDELWKQFWQSGAQQEPLSILLSLSTLCCLHILSNDEKRLEKKKSFHLSLFSTSLHTCCSHTKILQSFPSALLSRVKKVGRAGAEEYIGGGGVGSMPPPPKVGLLLLFPVEFHINNSTLSSADDDVFFSFHQATNENVLLLFFYFFQLPSLDLYRDGAAEGVCIDWRLCLRLRHAPLPFTFVICLFLGLLCLFPVAPPPLHHSGMKRNEKKKKKKTELMTTGRRGGGITTGYIRRRKKRRKVLSPPQKKEESGDNF